MNIAPKKYCVVDMDDKLIFVEAYGLKEARSRAAKERANALVWFGEEREYAVMTPEKADALFAKYHGGATKSKWDALKRKRPPAVRLAA